MAKLDERGGAVYDFSGSEAASFRRQGAWTPCWKSRP